MSGGQSASDGSNILAKPTPEGDMETAANKSQARAVKQTPAAPQGTSDKGNPVTKTRKSRKSKNAPAMAQENDSTNPALIKPDGQLSESEYIRNGGIREPVPPVNPSGLYSDTYEDARRDIGHLSWMPPANDPTIPTNDEELRGYVLELYRAMIDMSSYVDKTGPKFTNRWLDSNWVKGTEKQDGDTLTNPYYPVHWLQKRCWDVAVSFLVVFHYIECSRMSRLPANAFTETGLAS